MGTPKELYTQHYYAKKALVNSLRYHRNEILSLIEPTVCRTAWPTIRKKVLDHLGERGIEGQINDLLAPRIFIEEGEVDEK